MAYVRQRTTKTGTVSTALIASYRDAWGRPRQRLLANLHGEPDTLRALARLAVRRTSLLADRQALANGKATDEEGELIDVRFARQLIADIDAELADLAREQAILKRHCTATPKEIQATAKAYQRELENAANAAVGRM